MQHFVIGDFRLITSFHQHFETGLHQRGRTTAQHRLLAEQIGFGLFLEGGLDDVGARAAQAASVRERELLGLATGVLVDRIDARHAAADFIFATYQCARALRRDQHHVQIRARLDHVEMHVQAVREQQAGALLHVRRNDLFVELLLHHVRGQHRDQISGLYRFGRRNDGEAIGLGLGFGRATGAQANGDVEAGIAQVQRMRAALAAVADDRDGRLGVVAH